MRELPNNFYGFTTVATTTMSKKDLRELLLAHPRGSVFINGQSWDIKNKHLGVGIYKVWVTRDA